MTVDYRLVLGGVSALTAGYLLFLRKREETAEEIAVKNRAEIEGRVFIVTGATSGIGHETARVLAAQGGHVVLACRDVRRAGEVKAELEARYPSAKVDCFALDVGSLSSVKAFCAAFLATSLPLHCLINNAGVFGLPFSLSEDGYEKVWATNYLGGYLLAELLSDRLRQSAPARVVNVSSKMHFMLGNSFKVSERLPPTEKGYSTYPAYALSKGSQILHAFDYNTRMQEYGVTAYSVEPGMIRTNIARESSSFSRYLMYFFTYPIRKSLETGAATTLFCAVSPQASPGCYHADAKPDTPTSSCFSEENALALRELSHKCCQAFL